jgi:hypothetical protein
MKFYRATALLIVAATGVWAQTAGPSARPLAGRARTVIATTTDADSKTADMRAKAAMNQRVDEMQTTLARMHALLKQMQASAAVKNSKDPVTKANLEMWGLMIQQLDKQFDQLKIATRERQDMDARRAAMYKQAQEKAAQAARNAQAQARAGADAAPQSGSQPAAAPAPQPAPAPSSSSPN